jgi:hypothetical protein
MSLANELSKVFGNDLGAKSASRQLAPGSIIKMLQQMDDGNVKEKWFVVIQVDGSTVTCVMNTKIPKLFLNKPHLLHTQIEVTKADHPFMENALSHLDCSKVKIYPTDDVVAQLAARPEWIKGKADNALLGNMVNALSNTPLIKKDVAASYCAILTGAMAVSATTPVPTMQASQPVVPPPAL